MNNLWYGDLLRGVQVSLPILLGGATHTAHVAEQSQSVLKAKLDDCFEGCEKELYKILMKELWQAVNYSIPFQSAM